MEADEIINRLRMILEQTLLYVELLQDGVITPDTYKAWLDGQWAVIHQLHGQLRNEGDK